MDHPRYMIKVLSYGSGSPEGRGFVSLKKSCLFGCSLSNISLIEDVVQCKINFGLIKGIRLCPMSKLKILSNIKCSK